MAEILRKTLSNHSIIGPLHVWCYYQNEGKMTMTTFNFIDALLTKVFFYNISHQGLRGIYQKYQRQPCAAQLRQPIKKSLVLCHLKRLRLYTGLFKFELDHYLTNAARVKCRYCG